VNLIIIKGSSGSMSGLFMWGLIWTKYNWYRFVYKCFVYPVSTIIPLLPTSGVFEVSAKHTARKGPVGQKGPQTYRIPKDVVDYFGLNAILFIDSSILRYMRVFL
jgi:hypothetical protein